MMGNEDWSPVTRPGPEQPDRKLIVQDNITPSIEVGQARITRRPDDLVGPLQAVAARFGNNSDLVTELRKMLCQKLANGLNPANVRCKPVGAEEDFHAAA